MALGRNQILEAPDIQVEPVHVPEWAVDGDDVVYVKGLNGTERDAFEGSLLASDRKTIRYENIRAKLCAKTICDEGGKRIFSDADIPSLASKSASALQRCFEVAQRLSGITDSDVTELVDGLKNDQSDGSTSG